MGDFAAKGPCKSFCAQSKKFCFLKFLEIQSYDLLSFVYLKCILCLFFKLPSENSRKNRSFPILSEKNASHLVETYHSSEVGFIPPFFKNPPLLWVFAPLFRAANPHYFAAFFSMPETYWHFGEWVLKLYLFCGLMGDRFISWSYELDLWGGLAPHFFGIKIKDED